MSFRVTRNKIRGRIFRDVTNAPESRRDFALDRLHREVIFVSFVAFASGK